MTGPAAATRTIGFVGLGQMGRPIAANLMQADTRLLVGERNPDLLAEFRGRGAEAATCHADFGCCDTVFLCLPHGEAVRDVLLGPDGIAAALPPGRAVVDLSTIDHATTTEMAAALGRAGIGFLDAPVSGMEARARDRTLTVMCGGDRALFDALRPLLGRIGSTVLYMGPTGSGQMTKLVNQLLFDINAAAMAEILPMAAKMGLDPAAMATVVNSGTGRSYASEFFLPRILRGHFSDGYPMSHAYKDLVGAAELGARLCVPMPVLAAATATYQAALLQGDGALDKGAMIRVFERLLGVRFRAAGTEERDD